MAAADKKDAKRTAAVRLPPSTYRALQLALPFVDRNSMQELLESIIESFLAELQSANPGFEKALEGLLESQARREGVLSRRTVR